MDIGICLTCGDECNMHSQNCGSCNRKLTGYGLGWNPAPKRAKPETVSLKEWIAEIGNLQYKVLLAKITHDDDPTDEQKMLSYYKAIIEYKKQVKYFEEFIKSDQK